MRPLGKLGQRTLQKSIRQDRPVQRIIKIRRDYNRWVADETREDFALRFAPRAFRKWSGFRVANTAFGAVSFLALEAIGAALTFSYGFVNAMCAIAATSVVIFLTGLPIAYHAARNGLDMDLLTRGAGFGYLGSTITSLIYAGFTFIFFALEAAIMAQAFELWFDMPRSLGYLLSALLVIPLVTHGITAISRMQLWTQPLWLALLALPFIAIALKNPAAFSAFTSLNGRLSEGDAFSWAAFGAASTVAAALIAQIGEQVDFLRFMPEKTAQNRWQWWVAVVVAGPGWIVLGAAKMVGGGFLAHIALQAGASLQQALEPTHMYRVGFEQAVGGGWLAIFLTGLFVIVSQVKINVTNAYAGSLAWSNFFARLTHSHPGRVVWLLFNVLIAILLMVLGVFEALEQVLGLYAHLAVAWVGALVADLVISKPLGLSPKDIEFRRAYLYDINPAGFGAMLLASVLSVTAYAGAFGEPLRAASSAIALGVALLATPLIAWATSSRFFIARPVINFGPRHRTLRCVVCRNRYESDDMASCPAYGKPICSLCCTLEARCEDRCKPDTHIHLQFARFLARLLPEQLSPLITRRLGHYGLVLVGMMCVLGAMLWLLYAQEALHMPTTSTSLADLQALFVKVAAGLLLLAAVAAWWLVLANESRHVAQEESERQNLLLQKEIDAHRATDVLLQKAKEVAETANLAKSRFLTGMSHEMRSPLNSILGYSQVLMRSETVSPAVHDAASTIQRSGEHLTSLVDGLLELSRIEAGRLRLEREPVALAAFVQQIVKMFAPQAHAAGLQFQYEQTGVLPAMVNADAKRLRQILINLLGNALKFTLSGKVTLRIRYLREMAHIDVIDTGLGIAAADQERIFLPFERSATPSSIEGIGLGLTITRLLVDLMGGDLRLQSAVGQGSQFTVRLYLPSCSADPQGTEGKRIHGYEGRRRRILLVDDQTAHRHLLRVLLEPLGFIVDEAASGEGCLNLLAHELPDLLLLDINLPGMNGWQICAAIRQRYLDLPIVMVSANAHENTAHQRNMHGASGFLAKPIQDTDLLETVRSALRLTWLLKQADLRAEVPPAAALRELLELSAAGYPRAFTGRLIELTQESSAQGAWVQAQLAAAANDIKVFNQKLLDAIEDHASS